MNTLVVKNKYSAELYVLYHVMILCLYMHIHAYTCIYMYTHTWGLAADHDVNNKKIL